MREWTIGSLGGKLEDLGLLGGPNEGSRSQVFFQIIAETSTGRVKPKSVPVPVSVPIFQNLPHTHFQPILITHSSYKRGEFYGF